MADEDLLNYLTKILGPPDAFSRLAKKPIYLPTPDRVSNSSHFNSMFDSSPQQLGATLNSGLRPIMINPRVNKEIDVSPGSGREPNQVITHESIHQFAPELQFGSKDVESWGRSLSSKTLDKIRGAFPSNGGFEELLTRLGGGQLTKKLGTDSANEAWDKALQILARVAPDKAKRLKAQIPEPKQGLLSGALDNVPRKKDMKIYVGKNRVQ